MSPLPLGGEVAVSAAGEGAEFLLEWRQCLKWIPSPGPERPTSPASGRGELKRLLRSSELK
jgi:hypothetical protein